MNNMKAKIHSCVWMFVVIGLGFSSVFTLGCGPRELPKKKTYPAEGRLLYKGEPVRFAIIELEPTDPTTGANADASTDVDGAFHLRSYSNDEPDGAVPGEYTVRVSPGRAKPAGYDPKKGPQYTDVPAESRQTTVVIEAGDNNLEVVLPDSNAPQSEKK